MERKVGESVRLSRSMWEPGISDRDYERNEEPTDNEAEDFWNKESEDEEKVDNL